jgi:hypothetical protein
MTSDLLKQSAIPWSYTYKPPESDTTYDVTNICPIDTTLQTVFFLWFRGFDPILLWRRILYFFKP